MFLCKFCILPNCYHLWTEIFYDLNSWKLNFSLVLTFQKLNFNSDIYKNINCYSSVNISLAFPWKLCAHVNLFHVGFLTLRENNILASQRKTTTFSYVRFWLISESFKVTTKFVLFSITTVFIYWNYIFLCWLKTIA